MPTVPFKVKAIFEYGSPHDDDLSFPDGQIITVTAEEDDEWYAGEFVDSAGEKHEGIFPRNFVEKYEPEIPLRPARPVRPKKDAEAATPAPMASTTESAPTEAAAATGEHKVLSERPIESDSPRLGARASPPSIQSSSRQPASATPAKSLEQTQQKQASKDVPTQLPERSGTGSFKDRIAAFNKAAAPPIAPFKPGGQGTSGSAGFIKKPFVAPPPSKNAYMPPQREPPPTKVYRREEDPALNEAADDSESSMPLLGDKAETPGEEQSKPTSLKDRIALLQKQQLEQAARHAEAAQKKEKPKKPPKKQTDPQEAVQATEAAAEADPDRLGDTAGKKSVDFADDDSESLGGDGGRQAPNIAYMATPPPPSRELMSDTNDADYSAGGDTEEAEDTSTSKEDDHEKGRRLGGISKHADAPAGEVEAEASDEDADQEEEVDPEIRRRMEIRERMAKMSGGMGLMGMFGPPGSMPMPVKKGRASGDAERDVSGNHEKDEAVERAAPVPVPGMSNIGSLKRKPNQAEVNDSTDEDSVQTPSQQLETTEAERSGETIELPRPPPRSSMDHGPPPIPQGRAVPPPPPRETRTPPLAIPAERSVQEEVASPQGRAPPPPPPRASMPLSPGELSDDEMSAKGSLMYPDYTADEKTPLQNRDAPLPPIAPQIPMTRPGKDGYPPSQASPMSPPAKDKRASRAPPSLPPSSPTTGSNSEFRAPPPPPPGQPPNRKSTSQPRNMALPTKEEGAEDSEEEVTEYDGDYDTDIASSAKHKDALKSHARDSSLDEDTLMDRSTPKGGSDQLSRGPPPLPNVSAPRDVPPPPPTQTAKHARKSSDMPRAAPPPVPIPKEPPREEDENEYDPYRYNAPPSAFSPTTSQKAFSPIISPPEQTADDDDDLYDASPRSARAPPLPAHGPPPPAPMQPPQPPPNAPRQSLDISRPQTTSRRSVEAPRPSGEHGFMATDIDLAPSSQWYAQTPDVPPPSIQNRNDILYEIESSTSSKRGGKTTISKDVYVLYMDYSQTIITAHFDASDPASVTLEQRHERSPPPPRQDQLETASSQFGSHLASSIPSKANTTIGDGTPHALILDLLKPFSNSVLLPIGTRAYGALVYANLANASTQQFDEIRPGDIVTFRNAKFAGHRGNLHTKYSMEVGKPDHVAVVGDWDGTKKKIRVWEQKGKEGKEKEKEREGKSGHVHGAKVREESYRVADLKSGEVRVWRVMGRGWVGWEGGQ